MLLWVQAGLSVYWGHESKKSVHTPTEMLPQGGQRITFSSTSTAQCTRHPNHNHGASHAHGSGANRPRSDNSDPRIGQRIVIRRMISCSSPANLVFSPHIFALQGDGCFAAYEYREGLPFDMADFEQPGSFPDADKNTSNPTIFRISSAFRSLAASHWRSLSSLLWEEPPAQSCPKNSEIITVVTIEFVAGHLKSEKE